MKNKCKYCDKESEIELKVEFFVDNVKVYETDYLICEEHKDLKELRKKTKAKGISIRIKEIKDESKCPKCNQKGIPLRFSNQFKFYCEKCKGRF